MYFLFYGGLTRKSVFSQRQSSQGTGFENKASVLALRR
jgi:hypothetical protein